MATYDSSRIIPSRPHRFQDITGQVFGRWTVISFQERRNKSRYLWVCRCACGNVKAVAANDLKNGMSKSCGCYRRENPYKRRNGMSGQSIYKRWRAMIRRCYEVHKSDYSYYGGRGIFVCERWHTFENFFADMGYPPTSKHTLERVDNDGPYSQDNCIWALQKVQTRNRRSTKLLTLYGVTKCMTDWAIEFGIPKAALQYRLSSGWPVEDAITIPSGMYKIYRKRQ